MDGVGPFKIFGVYRVKELYKGKLRLDVTAVITYTNPFVVNAQHVTVSFLIV